ncbi:MAG: glycosyltransferase [Oscillibacter sp.]|nr:glycosyltransferase [Oscillibacter sp.]
MVVIHIAHIDPSVLGGVQVVVPQHVTAQGRIADVALLNTHGEAFEGITMLPVEKHFSLQDFPAPFDSPDLVVFHEIYRVEFLGIYKKLKKLGIPYLIVPHAGLTRHAQHIKRLKKTAANLLLFREFVASAAAVQFLTEQERSASLFVDKGFVCGNGMMVPEHRKSVFREENLRFLYIGRLDVFHKGLDLLVSAVAECGEELRSHGCSVHLFGPELDGVHGRLHDLISANGVGDLMEVHGAVTGAEKQRELLAADCFVQASRFEGMPLGVLEALGYGLPCIVTDGTCMDDFIREHDAGWTCAASADSLAAALRQAIRERERLAEKSTNAVLWSRREFSWEAVAARTLSHYETLIKQTE